MDIESWKYFETSMDEKKDDAFTPGYDDGSWADFKLWDTWGGYDKVAWFCTTISVPESFAGGQLALKCWWAPEMAAIPRLKRCFTSTENRYRA